MYRRHVFRTDDLFLTPKILEPQARFQQITRCFIRKDHSCGKFLGASKSCFIACPSTEEIQPLLELISEKCAKLGIEAVVAVKERAYGQDIFCTKICGRIIEAQFCIAVLDDYIHNDLNIANPNVYYEYGIMAALGKHIIPLQKEGQKLAFTIQTHDTIKYTSGNLAAELERALKDAVKLTEEDRSGREEPGALSTRLVQRSLEINGYQIKDYDWFLRREVEDTVFMAFGCAERQEYILLTIASTREELLDALTDMRVLAKRFESRRNDLLEGITAATAQLQKLQGQEASMKTRGPESGRDPSSYLLRDRLPVEIEKAKGDIRDKTEKSKLIENSKFGIILCEDAVQLKPKLLEEYSKMDKGTLSLPLYVGDTTSIQIDDLAIPFTVPTL